MSISFFSLPFPGDQIKGSYLLSSTVVNRSSEKPDGDQASKNDLQFFAEPVAFYRSSLDEGGKLSFTVTEIAPVIYPDGTNTKPVFFPTQGVAGSITAAFCAALSLATFLSLAFITFIFSKHRSLAIIRAQSRSVTSGVLVGMLLCSVASVLYYVSPTTLVCRSRVYTFVMGLSWFLALTLLKNYRVFALFMNRNFMVPPLSNKVRLSPFSCPLSQ